jgi:hypothetical protein
VTTDDGAVTASGERAAPDYGSDPSAIEAEIARRRDHLAATVDELARRAHPKAIARQGAADAKDRVRAAALTPQGELRIERLGALAAAAVVIIVLGALLRRRRRRRVRGRATGL